VREDGVNDLLRSALLFRELDDEKGIADASWALAIGQAATGGDVQAAIAAEHARVVEAEETDWEWVRSRPSPTRRMPLNCAINVLSSSDRLARLECELLGYARR
jgi:hypothetical protein